jgi:hypothetical protein
MKRTMIGALLVLVLGALSGCITFLTELHVRPDGSGTMVQTMSMNPEAMKNAMKTMAAQMGGTVTESKDEKADSKKDEKSPFTKEDLASRAGDLGEGVKLVSAEEIDTPMAKGVKATYEFADINKLSFNPKPGAALGMAPPGGSSEDALHFHFRKDGGRSVLTVVMGKKPEKKEETPAPSSNAQADDQSLAMMRQMFQGLHIGIAVDVDGKILKTTCPYVEGSRVTLADLDFDKLLADQKRFRKASGELEAARGDDQKTLEALQSMPGIKVVTAPEITIEFAKN